MQNKPHGIPNCARHYLTLSPAHRTPPAALSHHRYPLATPTSCRAGDSDVNLDLCCKYTNLENLPASHLITAPRPPGINAPGSPLETDWSEFENIVKTNSNLSAITYPHGPPATTYLPATTYPQLSILYQLI